MSRTRVLGRSQRAFRWENPDNGEVVTASPTWICVWRDRYCVGRGNLVAGPLSAGPLVLDVTDLPAWYAGWVEAGRPS